MTRDWPWRSAVALCGATLALGCAAAGQGAYFPTSWGWLTLAFLWVSGLALVLRRPRLSSPEVWVLATLAGLIAWTSLSSAWALDPSDSIEEVQRTLVYGAAGLALATSLRRRQASALVGGAVTATTVIALYGLATRLFPDHFGGFDPSWSYRLYAPIGYANALGAFLAIGLLLALGVALRADRTRDRCVAAATLPALGLALYFTFSRGAALAVAVGLIAMIALDRRRLRLAAGTLLLATPTGVGVFVASRRPALVDVTARLGDAIRAGHRVALIVVALSIVSAAGAVAISVAERRIRVGGRARRVAGLLVRLAPPAAVIVLLVAAWPPGRLATRAWDDFAAPASTTTNLNQHLLSLSGAGRLDAWRVALQDFGARPLTGSGAGSYQSYWNRNRPRAAAGSDLRDAHSLYLETAAELGLVGLGLLVVVLATPLARLRAAAARHPFGSATGGAYVAYLLHTGVDWDWEVPAVTLAGLLAGWALLLMARDEDTGTVLRLPARAVAGSVALAACAFSFTGLLGSSALSAGDSALRHGRFTAAAADAATARRWEPWSAQPWQLLASVRYQNGDLAGAAASYRRALRLDPRDWELWFDLGFALDGRPADAAFAQARRLDPLNLEIPAAGA